MPASGRDRLLDAWRGLSVLLVIVHHAVAYRFRADIAGHSPDTGLAQPVPTTEFPGSTIRHAFVDLFNDYAGQLGVRIFFVISGYIITMLLVREFHRNRRVSIAAFYLRRAFRILPSLWLVLAVTLALELSGWIVGDPHAVLISSLFLCNIDQCGFFVGHTWSLGVEEQFYIAWPMMLVTLRFRAVAALSGSLVVLLLAMAGAKVPYVSADNLVSFSHIAAGCLVASSERFRNLVTAPRACRSCSSLQFWYSASRWFQSCSLGSKASTTRRYRCWCACWCSAACGTGHRWRA